MTQRTIDYESLKSGGFMRQRQPNQFAFRLRVVGGRIEADQLRALADAAEKYGDGHIHLTTRQGIEIPFIHADDVESVRKDMADANLRKGTCGPRIRGIMACQGNTVCPRGLVNPQDLAQKIDEKYFAAGVPHKFKISITGCPASCAKPQENDFGAIGGVEPKWLEEECIGCGLCQEICRKDAIIVEDGVVTFDREKCDLCGDCISSCPTDAWIIEKTGYTLLIGGKIGRFPQLGTQFVELVDEVQLFEILDKTIRFFKDSAQKGERIGDTVARVGIEPFRKAVL
ncbi:MAG: 4Fe-4S binding protein [Methanosarcinales archaeon]|nr:4Fe-4S binding protein [Methanosarcinales archaeon]